MTKRRLIIALLALSTFISGMGGTCVAASAQTPGTVFSFTYEADDLNDTNDVNDATNGSTEPDGNGQSTALPPQTGDSGELWGRLALMAASGLGLTAILLGMRKQTDND